MHRFTKGGVIVWSVVAIVLVIAIVAGLQSFRSQSRDEQRLKDIALLQESLDQYYVRNGAFPPDLEVLKQQNIIQELPMDPSASAIYNYSPSSNAVGYILSTKLEANVTDVVFDDSYKGDTSDYQKGTIESCIPPFYCIQF
ncbi:MAG: hypothetical protein Q8R26_01755 [bacterium]|nr:hypothetical protein [bacterium]